MIIAMDTERFDQGGDYNTSTYKFTAPVTGRYQFNWMVRIDQLTNNISHVSSQLITSNFSWLYGNILVTDNFSGTQDYTGFPGSALVDMDAGDTAHVTALKNGGTGNTDAGGDGDTSFSGYLVA